MAKKIIVTVEKTNTGYSAGADEFPAYTAGDSLAEIKNNIVESLNLYFDNKRAPVTMNDIQLKPDIASFFDYYKIINPKAFSEKIGMDKEALVNYIKGKKKPTISQTKKIFDGFQKVGKELSEIRF